MAPAEGDSEKYEILEVIGRGAFGVIRKVRRKADGHILCRKEINYIKMSGKERDQLHAEFSILQSLRHENIVGYFHREHIKHTQDLYLYMEYCGGGDLGTIIKNHKRDRTYAKEEFVWKILSQLVTALYRCHYGIDAPEPGSDLAAQRDPRKALAQAASPSMMILHRDLKPENIFLGEDQSVKLGDFGLSKLMQANDFASTYVGTPFYMSPEICAGEKYTLQSDIWSVGCMMYELCTKQPPFNAKTHLELSQNIRKGHFTPIPDIYSRDLQNVIANCLRVNPLHRPDTASLLTVPYIWIARKSQALANISKALRTREEMAEYKQKQAEERLSALEADKEAMRAEIEATVRREWELKARLEIDRQGQLTLERLRKRFDKEVAEKVQAAVAKELARLKSNTHARALRENANPQAGSARPSSDVEVENINPQSSVATASGEEDFPSTTDLTELSELSLHSPKSSTTRPPQHLPKKTKTPFARSKTTFDSPIDVPMSEPSPMSISSLALSPRRNAAAQAAVDAAASGAKSNIFAEAARQKARWEPTLAYTSDNEADNNDDSDSDIPDLPSPTRRNAINDPFKMPPHPQALKARPGLMRQNTTATMQKLTTQPTLFPTAGISNTATQIRAGIQQSGIPRSTTETDLRANLKQASTSPRRLSKLPSKSDLLGLSEAVSPTRKNATGLQSKLKPTHPQETKGRTLIELAQARAGGRPVSSHGAFETQPTKKRTAAEKEKDLPQVPVWDPDVVGEECMPSPFLKRDVRNVNFNSNAVVLKGLR